jgi:hypothetical protein
MEKEKTLLKKMAIMFVCLWVVGCTTYRPPLFDSDVPRKMPAGEYVDENKETYIVNEESPRWAVTEGYLYNSVNSVAEKPSLFQTYENYLIIIGTIAAIYFIRRT